MERWNDDACDNENIKFYSWAVIKTATHSFLFSLGVCNWHSIKLQVHLFAPSRREYCQWFFFFFSLQQKSTYDCTYREERNGWKYLNDGKLNDYHDVSDTIATLLWFICSDNWNKPIHEFDEQLPFMKRNKLRLFRVQHCFIVYFFKVQAQLNLSWTLTSIST